MLVSPVCPVTALGIIQCRHQELIFLLHPSTAATGNRCSPKPAMPVLPLTSLHKVVVLCLLFLPFQGLEDFSLQCTSIYR